MLARPSVGQYGIASRTRHNVTLRGSDRRFARCRGRWQIYETLAQRVLSPEKVAALRDAVLSMDTLPDARQIPLLLSSIVAVRVRLELEATRGRAYDLPLSTVCVEADLQVRLGLYEYEHK